MFGPENVHIDNSPGQVPIDVAVACSLVEYLEKTDQAGRQITNDSALSTLDELALHGGTLLSQIRTAKKQF